ncbi:hypothetical protein SBADM41S_00338 [Streptomyces badius]
MTAITVPSYDSSPSCNASADSRSRLSVGSSSSSAVVPASSSSRIWNRACCPPDSRSKSWSPCRSSSYRRSTDIAPPRSLACSDQRMSTRVFPSSSGCACVCAKCPGTTRAPSFHSPVCATGSPASSRRKCDLPDPLEPRTATRSP